MGIIDFPDLTKALMNYGEKLDEDDIFLMRKAFNIADDKLLVDGMLIRYI